MRGRGADGLIESLGSGFDFKRILGIADALPMPLALIDQRERYLFCNQALADFFERPRAEILGKYLRDVIGEAGYKVRKPMLDAAIKGEKQWFAAELSHPTRGTVAVQTQYLPQIEDDGSVSGVVILVTDVTEQRVAERALRESEARFRRIANNAPVIMWVTRLDRHREFVNDAYLSFVGIPRSEVNAHEWRDFVHPDDFERVVVESMAGEATRRPFSLEARYKRADGVYRWLRSVSSPRFGPDGELIGFIGAAFDVTLAKEAEKELRHQVEERTAEVRESEARLRAIFDSVREVVVLLEPDGTVLQLNRTQANWRDADTAEAVGRKLWDGPTLLAYPQHRDTIRQWVSAAARGDLVQRELVMDRPRTPTAILDVSLRPVIGQTGSVLYILFEARDVTELKAAQEQLRQSQKMEALGQLTGGIAHDFNNLLTVVVGGLDLIVRRAEDPKLERYARNALEAAERGARLTAQLLAFSRVQRLEVRPTLVAPLIANMRPLLRNVLGPGIDKKFDLDDAAIPVLADPTQLELAVLNLAINARDAMPDGGTLSIRTWPVSVSGDNELEPGEYVELCIGDTGTGMPEDVVARAFDPFFTTKEVGKGTGLGLSMVYGVARQSGGTARIESRPGEGTTVRLYFPKAEGVSETADGDAASERTDGIVGQSAKVLVVDDDPDVRGFVVSSLEELGYQVVEAADGEAALVAFHRDPPDLVVLDYLMPGMSGAEVAREIRAARPEQPILFVSGYSETDAIRAAAPGAALLPKPFRSEGLAAAVRKVLSGT